MLREMFYIPKSTAYGPEAAAADLLIARPVRNARELRQQLALIAHSNHVVVVLAAAGRGQVIGRRWLRHGRQQTGVVATITAGRRVDGRRRRRRRGVHGRLQWMVVVGA